MLVFTVWCACMLVSTAGHSFNYCSDRYVRLCGEKGQHVACQFPREGHGKACVNYNAIRFTPMLRNLIIYFINSHRQRIAAGKERVRNGVLVPQPRVMMQVEWDRELASLAQRLANQCNFTHDQCRATVRYPFAGQTVSEIKWRRRMNVLVEQYSACAVKRVLEAWWGERRRADAKQLTRPYKVTRRGSMWGDWSQLAVWTLDAVGCGAVRHGARPARVLLVCDYSRTNMLGQPTLIPGPLGRCPNNTARREDSPYPLLCARIKKRKREKSRVQPTNDLICNLNNESINHTSREFINRDIKKLKEDISHVHQPTNDLICNLNNESINHTSREDVNRDIENSDSNKIRNPTEFALNRNGGIRWDVNSMEGKEEKEKSEDINNIQENNTDHDAQTTPKEYNEYGENNEMEQEPQEVTKEEKPLLHDSDMEQDEHDIGEYDYDRQERRGHEDGFHGGGGEHVYQAETTYKYIENDQTESSVYWHQHLKGLKSKYEVKKDEPNKTYNENPKIDQEANENITRRVSFKNKGRQKESDVHKGEREKYISHLRGELLANTERVYSKEEQKMGDVGQTEETTGHQMDEEDEVPCHRDRVRGHTNYRRERPGAKALTQTYIMQSTRAPLKSTIMDPGISMDPEDVQQLIKDTGFSPGWTRYKLIPP